MLLPIAAGIFWAITRLSINTLPSGLVLSGILSGTALCATVHQNSLCGTRWGFDQMFARLLVNATLDWGRLALTVGAGVAPPAIATTLGLVSLLVALLAGHGQPRPGFAMALALAIPASLR